MDKTKTLKTKKKRKFACKLMHHKNEIVFFRVKRTVVVWEVKPLNAHRETIECSLCIPNKTNQLCSFEFIVMSEKILLRTPRPINSSIKWQTEKESRSHAKTMVNFRSTNCKWNVPHLYS